MKRIGDGIYEGRGHTVIRVDHGYGIEWELHEGDHDRYCGSGDTWVNTFQLKRDAIAAIPQEDH